MNQGQICMSTEPIIIDEKVADAFVQKFVAKVKNLPCGDPRKAEVVLGAVVGMPTVNRVNALVKDAVSRCGKVLLGGDAQSTIMPAVIVDHVTPEMQIFREESLGPSVSITRFKTIEEAITLANDTEYGLTAAVFGCDVARAFDVAKRIDSGMFISTVQRFTMNARCPSEASKPAATADSEARQQSTSSLNCAGSRSRQRRDTIRSSGYTQQIQITVTR